MNQDNWSNIVANLVRLRTIKKSLEELTLTPISSELGMSTHERIHIQGMVEKSITQCEQLLNGDDDAESKTN